MRCPSLFALLVVVGVSLLLVQANELPALTIKRQPGEVGSAYYTRLAHEHNQRAQHHKQRAEALSGQADKQAYTKALHEADFHRQQQDAHLNRAELARQTEEFNKATIDFVRMPDVNNLLPKNDHIPRTFLETR